MSTVLADALAVAARPLGDDAVPVLARLAGSLGEDARTAHRELAGLDGTAATRRRAEIRAAARAPVPPTLRRVHPTWLEAALADLPVRARTAIAAPTSHPADVWLARLATATMPPTPASPRAGRPLERVLVRDSAQVVDWLVSAGADQMALALGPAAVAHPLLAAAARRIGLPPRQGALGSTRAAIGRCQGVTLDDPQQAFVVVGARAIAPHVASDPLGAAQLVYRLPRSLGIVVQRELAANCAASLDNAPAWSALA